MKTVKCKNCDASFSDELAYCPYCGTMNKRGAYKDFRAKISSMIDSILGLKEDVQRSVSRIILSSLFRSLIFVLVIAGLAFLVSRFSNVNYYNDKEYDQKAYDEIIWMDEHIDELNEAYEKGDYKAIKTLYYENTRAVSGWSHYPSYCLKSEYETIESETRFDQYQLQRMLYFLYFPEYITGRNGMNYVDRAEYEEMRSAVVSSLHSRGYTDEELETIYDKCSDSYGYINSSDLKEYVKEDGNGKL
ncbi:MAG: hypothetical protein J5528_05890 [Firmicutes bacterium]|nr:hypothetical protein [Bacillota bacterium]